MSVENKLREEIQNQLKQVTEINCPKLHAKLQTPEGYKWAEIQVIMWVIETSQAPAMAIPQIESELQ